jgi:uncharacterized protein YgiM (DUF1202 family)
MLRIKPSWPQALILTRWEATVMRVSLALGLVLLMAIRLLPVAAATSIVEVAASRGDIRSGPSAAHEIMGEIRQGEKYAALEKRGVVSHTFGGWAGRLDP